MISAEDLRKRIDAFPRVRLVNLPTPLEKLPRLTKLLNGPQLWMKRDDCTGLAFGGNKERKTEFALGDALSKRADVVITAGPIQSNHSRATAAAAKKLGLKVVLALSGGKPPNCDGNLLLDLLLGAEIRFLHGRPTGAERARFMEEIADDLRKEGHVPYVIPAGASYPPGAIAYVNAMLELIEQAQSSNFEIDCIVHAAGSGGTQAGLVLGNLALGTRVNVLGICGEPHSRDKLTEETIRIAKETAILLDLNVPVRSSDVVLNEDYAGEAYGTLTSEAVGAIRLVAQTEGILLDPVYTCKAMVGLMNLIEQGHFRKDDNVVFVHTGGTPALFPYKKELF